MPVSGCACCYSNTIFRFVLNLKLHTVVYSLNINAADRKTMSCIHLYAETQNESTKVIKVIFRIVSIHRFFLSEKKKIR